MFRWYDCLEGHILLGCILSTASLILFMLVTFSTPYTRTITFLNLTSSQTTQPTSFGSFGYCTLSVCEYTNVGYEYGNGGEIIRWLTRCLVLFPLAAVFSFLALLMLTLYLLRAGRALRNPVYFRTTAVFSAFFAVLAETFAFILFITARNRFNGSNAAAGGPGNVATYGAALWLGLAGALCAFLSACIGGPPYTGTWMWRADNGVAYNV